jgi:tetratricopeptide (TPR) repeat protein
MPSAVAREAPSDGGLVSGSEILDLLTALVQKSLVVYEEDAQGSGRYRLLETVRQYGRDRLLEARDVASRDRHRDWFVALTERAAPNLQFGSEERAWMDRLEQDHDNLRAALEWCHATEEGREAGLRAVGALTWFWVKRGHLGEGWQSMTSLLAAGSGVPAAARGKALVGAMSVAFFRFDYPAMAALAEEGLALGRESGDRWLTAVSLRTTSGVALAQGDLERAQQLAQEGLALARELGDRYLMTTLTQSLAMVAETRGDYERARTLNQEALDLYRELEDTGGTAIQLSHLAWLARREGNSEQARALWSEALALWRAVGDRSLNFSFGLLAHADLALAQGDPDTARACYEEALTIAREQNDKPRIAAALLGLARVAQVAGNPQTARARLEEAQALDAGNADIPMDCGHLLLELGDYAAARSCYEEGLALRRAGGDTGGTAWALVAAGHAAWLQGEPIVTRSHALEALGLFQERNDKEGLLASLESLCVAALAQGRKERAARLMGAVDAQREAPGRSGPAWWRGPRERIGEAVRTASLEQAFVAAWAEGLALSLEEAVVFALRDGADG